MLRLLPFYETVTDTVRDNGIKGPYVKGKRAKEAFFPIHHYPWLFCVNNEDQRRWRSRVAVVVGYSSISAVLINVILFHLVFGFNTIV